MSYKSINFSDKAPQFYFTSWEKPFCWKLSNLPKHCLYTSILAGFSALQKVTHYKYIHMGFGTWQNLSGFPHTDDIANRRLQTQDISRKR